MAIEAQHRKLSTRDIQGRPKITTPLRLKEMGLLRDVFSYLAEKRGVTPEYFTDKRREGSILQELIEWNEGVPIGATDYEIAAVIKRDRTTVLARKRRLREHQERDTLRTTVRNALDKIAGTPPVTDLFVYDGSPSEPDTK